LDATDEEVKDACRAAAVHDKIETFPNKYLTKVGERGVKLSGGENQRLAIARAMLRRPKIVILDEATSSVDAETEAKIHEGFRPLMEGRTTFIIAHRLSTVQDSDLILVISEGRIVEQGNHEQLIALKGKYVSLWSKQQAKAVLKRPDDANSRTVDEVAAANE
jgi:ABC-type multidrug transport system fused ATPase/permease subunit